MRIRAEIHGALERLQDGVPPGSRAIAPWLSANERDALILLEDKGLQLTADLLGITPDALGSWRRRRRQRKERLRALERA